MTAVLTPATYTVDPWDPGYGVAATGDELDGRGTSKVQLTLDVERPAGDWAAVPPARGVTPPSAVLFLDGVRRIDARLWVHGAAAQPVPGMAASLAVGLVCCNGSAQLADVCVDRRLYTTEPSAGPLVTRHARYEVERVEEETSSNGDQLSLAVQRRLARLEVDLALRWRAGSPVDDDLLVVDGPLHGRGHLPRTVGYVKTHDKAYLREPQAQIVAGLAPGERTPVFAMTTSWRRHSWYLRLPGSSGAPWSGVVRLEASADLDAADVVRLADLSTVVLPPLASVPHKDSRAPQNLVPIGGLERQLRHRLGDAALLYRSLRAAAATG
ncbi:MAG TPA: DNA double-strand break repair nuclease NurA [Pseudonocardiaceae bacterium]